MWESGHVAPGVTEYRAGNYAFHDRMSIAAGAASLDEARAHGARDRRQPARAGIEQSSTPARRR